MAENIKQIFDSNPSTTLPTTALLYAGLSPFGSSNDTAITAGNLAKSLATTTINFNSSFGTVAKSFVNVATTNDTPTLLTSIPVAENSAVTVTTVITGAEEGGLSGVGGTITAVARRQTGGNVTLVAAIDKYQASSGLASFTADVDTGTQSVTITVTGLDTINMSWVANVTVQTVLPL